ncbi:outer membrane protein assembly factor BamE [Aquisphaera insulae]|uniref:outer membrane protein assembly factor BamE n=1 Tax=Aquisphaera insulae TaxID=2712864 RepID=UPI0013EBE074|nr:outer membrane protein assembly factor BamE [Aquisphaera insulae]
MNQPTLNAPAIQESTANKLRFGSYTGLLYVGAMLGVLAYSLLRETGETFAFERLKPGMTPTQVAAEIGSPKAEAKDGERLVQTWKIPDGQVFTVEFQDGKLVTKERKPASR